jgi:hypothetical protein
MQREPAGNVPTTLRMVCYLLQALGPTSKAGAPLNFFIMARYGTLKTGAAEMGTMIASGGSVAATSSRSTSASVKCSRVLWGALSVGR